MIKPKKCKYCKDTFTPKAFNQKNCFKEECIKAFYQDNKQKINKATEKHIKAVRTNLKNELKSISQYIAESKVYFQKFVRLRDKDLPCISCGVFSDKNDGGHFRKAELYSGVIFDENNVHKQCQKCNRFLGGNEANYRNGLVERYGVKFVEELEEKANKTKNYKYTKEELTEIKKKYQLKIKEL